MMKGMNAEMRMISDDVINVSVIQNTLIKRNKIKKIRNENRSEIQFAN